MSSNRQSDIFSKICICWTVFGIWPGRTPMKYYKLYSAMYLLVTFLLYNIFLTLNLIYTPREIEYLIREIIFYFTEIAVLSKICMIIMLRDKIVNAFNLMDGEDLRSDDAPSRKIIEKSNSGFLTFFKFFAIMSHVAYSSQVFVPIITGLIFQTDLELPICKYYFLTDELRDKYFVFWFIYQSWGMYGHMNYNVTVDSFIAGLLLTAITQIRILKYKLMNLKLDLQREEKLSPEFQEKIQMHRLRKCLVRYDAILSYCNLIQRIIDITMYVVFGISTAIICVVMCGLLLPSSTETLVFMVMYLFAMTLQIFVPAVLGTQLAYESRELMFAAYSAEWIPRSESFKRSINVFAQRANKPIQMTGLKMFSLSLDTFTSIMKSAYSFFTLIRSFQE